MSRYLQVGSDVARRLFNELITWDIYGDLVVDDTPALRAFIDQMSDILDYEQPLQPALIFQLRPVLVELSDRGMQSAQEMLDRSQNYPTTDLLFTTTGRDRMLLNEDAISAYRAHQSTSAVVESH